MSPAPLPVYHARAHCFILPGRARDGVRAHRLSERRNAAGFTGSRGDLRCRGGPGRHGDRPRPHLRSSAVPAGRSPRPLLPQLPVRAAHAAGRPRRDREGLPPADRPQRLPAAAGRGPGPGAVPLARGTPGLRGQRRGRRGAPADLLHPHLPAPLSHLAPVLHRGRPRGHPVDPPAAGPVRRPEDQVPQPHALVAGGPGEPAGRSPGPSRSVSTWTATSPRRGARTS